MILRAQAHQTTKKMCVHKIRNCSFKNIMNHCKFRRAVDDQKSHTFGGQGYMAVGTEKGTGGPYFSKKPYSNGEWRGILYSHYNSHRLPPKKFQTFLLLLLSTALGKVSFYYTAYQKTTVFEFLISI